jgi:LacI family transcriptional regulator
MPSQGEFNSKDVHTIAQTASLVLTSACAMTTNPSTPQPRIRLCDIAERLKLSQPTVSRALRDDPRISAVVRRQVQQTAQAMDYRPDPMLTALAHYRRGRVKPSITAELAWLNAWPDPKKLRSFGEFNLYWKGAAAEAEEAGYRLEEFICNADQSPSRVRKILAARNIRGILIPPHQVSPEQLFPDWHTFQWDELCIVKFGHSIREPAAHLVTSDQMNDGLIALQEITRRGYRYVGFVTSTQHALGRVHFAAGYAYGQWELAPDHRLPPLLLSGSNPDEDLLHLASWLEKNEPEAILTDIASLREMLDKVGWPVPAKVGLAAMSVLDGNADAGIYQNSEEIGRAAVQLLISLIHHNERGIPAISREVLVEGRWQDGSTLPPR